MRRVRPLLNIIHISKIKTNECENMSNVIGMKVFSRD